MPKTEAKGSVIPGPELSESPDFSPEISEVTAVVAEPATTKAKEEIPTKEEAPPEAVPQTSARTPADVPVPASPEGEREATTTRSRRRRRGDDRDERESRDGAHPDEDPLPEERNRKGKGRGKGRESSTHSNRSAGSGKGRGKKGKGKGKKGKGKKGKKGKSKSDPPSPAASAPAVMDDQRSSGSYGSQSWGWRQWRSPNVGWVQAPNGDWWYWDGYEFWTGQEEIQPRTVESWEEDPPNPRGGDRPRTPERRRSPRREESQETTEFPFGAPGRKRDKGSEGRKDRGEGGKDFTSFTIPPAEPR